MLALTIEVVLLAWRTANEILHGQFDISGALHHGAFALAVLLLAICEEWRSSYADLAVLMQILHYPMALWYLGARAYCICEQPAARSLCIKLFRLTWWSSVGFRATCMLLSTFFAAGFARQSLRPVGSANVSAGQVQRDVLATILLSSLFGVFLWLDLTWTKWFIRRVGNVCDGPVGSALNMVCVFAGASLAPRILWIA